MLRKVHENIEGNLSLEPFFGNEKERHIEIRTTTTIYLGFFYLASFNVCLLNEIIRYLH